MENERVCASDTDLPKNERGKCSPSLNRRHVLHGALAAYVTHTTALAAADTPDPLIALCAEHDRLFKRYTDADEAWQRGELNDFEFQKIADPALDAASALTDRIASTQATTLEGLKAQYDHFLNRMGEDAMELYCKEWSVIIHTIQTGFKALA